MIDPRAGSTIRPPSTGTQGVSQVGGGRGGIADGSLVEGTVVRLDGDNYMVRIGSQMLSAKSTIPLFVGQRFRAVWDSSSMPPTLRLQQNDAAMLSHFKGRDQQIATALLSRGLPVSDATMQSMKQAMASRGGRPEDLGVMAELWARGIQMTESNISLMSWYMGLSPEQAFGFWKKIRERMNEKKYDSARGMLDALREEGDDPEVGRFMKAHALASKPARRGIDPASLLAPAWWPVDEGEDGGGMMARVSLAREEGGGVRVAWMNFELEADVLGLTRGDVMTNEHAIAANIRMRDEDQIPYVEEHLPELREDLKDVPLPIQHLGVFPMRDAPQGEAASKRGLDVAL